MKALEWSQIFSHYKSMGIFSDAHRQFLVKFCQMSYSSVNSWLSFLPTKKNPVNNEGARVVGMFSHYNLLGDISCHGNQS